MNVLWVTPQIPCLRTGGQVRQYHLLKRLASIHQITVLCLVQPEEDGEAEALRALGIQVVPQPFQPPAQARGWGHRLRSWAQLLGDPRPHYAYTYPLDEVRRHLRPILAEQKVDLVQIEHLFLAPLGNMTGPVPWLLTEIDIESKKAERQARLATTVRQRLAGWLETQKLRRWETRWVRRSAACIAMSNVEAAELRAISPETPVFVVPNGVDSTAFAPPEGTGGDRTGMLFLGNLGYAPNVDAVTYLCRQILPLVQSRYAAATLSIVGPHAPPQVAALGSIAGVHYAGFVQDVRPYLWRAAVCMVPVRAGGGTRLRILESLAAGCPVVSTTLGAEGLDLEAGRHLLIADDAAGLAQAALDLLADPEHRDCLATAGRHAVARLYDWGSIAPRLDQVYHTVAERAWHR